MSMSPTLTLAATQRGEILGTVRHRPEAVEGQSGGHADHVLLGNTRIDESPGETCREIVKDLVAEQNMVGVATGLALDGFQQISGSHGHRQHAACRNQCTVRPFPNLDRRADFEARRIEMHNRVARAAEPMS